MKKIILASASPRRHELLELLGIEHEVIPCKNKEPKIQNNKLDSKVENKTIEELVLKLACSKTLCVADMLSKEVKGNSIIIGADTIVVLEKEIIGKPKDKSEAIEMLKKLSGKIHEVYTGLCLYDCNKDKLHTAVEKTLVSMLQWEDEEIKAYIESENVLDKAGAYAIQGKGAALIERIEGCFYNVMGLPLSKLSEILKEVNFNFLQDKN